MRKSTAYIMLAMLIAVLAGCGASKWKPGGAVNERHFSMIPVGSSQNAHSGY
jgi:hypothetical protein